MVKRVGVIALFVVAGCTSGWSLDGAFADKGETLTGGATRYTDGGTIELYGSRGTHCNGSFHLANGTQGKGMMTCDDRRSGPFVLDTGMKSVTGSLSGRPFSVSLGRQPKARRL